MATITNQLLLDIMQESHRATVNGDISDAVHSRVLERLQQVQEVLDELRRQRDEAEDASYELHIETHNRLLKERGENVLADAEPEQSDVKSPSSIDWEDRRLRETALTLAVSRLNSNASLSVVSVKLAEEFLAFLKGGDSA